MTEPAQVLLRITAEQPIAANTLALTTSLVRLYSDSTDAHTSADDRSAMWLLTLNPGQSDGLREQLAVHWRGNGTVRLQHLSFGEVICE